MITLTLVPTTVLGRNCRSPLPLISHTHRIPELGQRYPRRFVTEATVRVAGGRTETHFVENLRGMLLLQYQR